jgi:hypothetical protein
MIYKTIVSYYIQLYDMYAMKNWDLSMRAVTCALELDFWTKGASVY